MIRVQSLGGLRVFRDGQELTSLPAKPLRASVLVHLAMERETSRQRLCFLLWPDSGPERARHALSQTLYELRRELGDGWLESTGERLAATDDLWTDVAQLVTATAENRHLDAVEAYTGPFLEGMALGGGVEFERWVEEERSKIHGMMRRAFRCVVTEATDPESRARLARGWVQLDPLDDEGQHALIESLAASGDRSGALDQFRIYSELIASELEVEPLHQTVELIERIKRGSGETVEAARDFSIGPGGVSESVRGAAAREPDEVAVAGNLSVSRLIGRGATGSVYLAREPALRRLVAVKVLDAELAADARARSRFEREAQSAARIIHPNVVPVYQIGTTQDGRPYLVMPYVKGGTLADRSRARGPLPPAEVRRLLAEAASALAAAHAIGVIHRDVRPANFLYDELTGRAYLADFGVAAVLETGTDESAHLTRTGELLGNAEYVSPEQARGDALDDRSDVYSLGIVGRVLLFGSPAGGRGAIDDFPDTELVELLRRATSTEPQYRPSAAELAEAFARSPGTQARNDWDLLGEIRRRRMVPFVGAYVVAGVMVMGAIDRLVEEGVVSTLWYRLALAFLIAGLNGVIVVSWFHGEKGPQPVSRSEIALLTVVVAAWLLATAVILA